MKKLSSNIFIFSFIILISFIASIYMNNDNEKLKEAYFETFEYMNNNNEKLKEAYFETLKDDLDSQIYNFKNNILKNYLVDIYPTLEEDLNFKNCKTIYPKYIKKDKIRLEYYISRLFKTKINNNWIDIHNFDESEIHFHYVELPKLNYLFLKKEINIFHVFDVISKKIIIPSAFDLKTNHYIIKTSNQKIIIKSKNHIEDLKICQ